MKRFTMLILVIAAALLPVRQTAAQGVEARDLTAEMISETQIKVTYDLIGDTEAEYEVAIFLNDAKDPGFEVELESATGDIGRGKYAGNNRSVIWNFMDDYPQLLEEDRDFKFRLTADRLTPTAPVAETRDEGEETVDEGGGVPWWVFVGGAAVAGGVAAVVLGGGDDGGTDPGGGSTTTGDFPGPPDRGNR